MNDAMRKLFDICASLIPLLEQEMSISHRTAAGLR